MININHMTNEDMIKALSWAKEEGWNPGKYDSDAYLSADPKGCFILKKDKLAIGSITAINYSSEFSFIGLFIIDPDFRNQGYGKMLWEHATNYLKNCKSIGLYAVSEMVPRYKLSGFNVSFKNLRWSGFIKSEKKTHEKIITSANLITDNTKDYIEKIAAYENSIFKVNRKNYLNNLIKLPGTHAILSLNNNSEEKEINGFIIIRPCVNKSYRIGPLYANSNEIAQKLVNEAINKIGTNQTIFMDSPESNEFTKKIASNLGLKHIDNNDTIAMYKGIIPEINNNNVYAVSSLELC
ncbi:MAG: hypothetical protein LEGION0398_MBIBDBAK_00247 [Legionellaceae bacterium]